MGCCRSQRPSLVLSALLAQDTAAAAHEAAGERALRLRPPLPLGGETSWPLGRLLLSRRLVTQRLVADLVQRAAGRRADDRVVDVDPVRAGTVVVDDPAATHAPVLAGWRLAAWPLPTDLHLARLLGWLALVANLPQGWRYKPLGTEVAAVTFTED